MKYNHICFTAYDYRAINITANVYAGGFVAPNFYFFGAYSDGIQEQREGLVLLLEIIESELDPRDVGNVSLSRSAYLIRINDSGTSKSCGLIHAPYQTLTSTIKSYALMHH